MSLGIQNQGYALSPLARRCAEKMIASYYDQSNWLTGGIRKLLDLCPNLKGFEETYLFTTQYFEELSGRSPLPISLDENGILESCNSDVFARYYEQITVLNHGTSVKDIFHCTISLIVIGNFGIWHPTCDMLTEVLEEPKTETIVLRKESTSSIAIRRFINGALAKPFCISQNMLFHLFE